MLLPIQIAGSEKKTVQIPCFSLRVTVKKRVELEHPQIFNYPLTSRMWHTIFLRCSNGNSFECPFTLRWLNTVLRAVKGNSRDGACFNQTNKHFAAKKAIVHRRRFLKIYSLKFCDIRQIFYFYRILNNENFKMEVEQTNFVTHLIIKVQLYY